MKPGKVSSAERAPPPIVAFASQTTTEHPARASVIAAARPFGPEPTTTASYSVGMLKWASDLGARFPISFHCATRWPFHAIELRDANQYRFNADENCERFFDQANQRMGTKAHLRVSRRRHQRHHWCDRSGKWCDRVCAGTS